MRIQFQRNFFHPDSSAVLVLEKFEVEVKVKIRWCWRLGTWTPKWELGTRTPKWRHGTQTPRPRTKMESYTELGESKIVAIGGLTLVNVVN